MRLTATITGLREVDQGLDLIARGRYIARGLDRAAERVVGVAKAERFLPRRDPSIPAVPGILTSRTGTLRESIRVRRGRPHRKGGQAAYHDVIFGAGGRYGPLHELGTGRLPPRPVLGPALNLAAPAFGGIFLEELDQEIAAAGFR